MFCVVFKDGFEMEFHVPLTPDVKRVLREEDVQAEFLQADGDELAYLYEQFPTWIPPRRRIVKFYGDMARNLVANL
jgi:hypothetical protein